MELKLFNGGGIGKYRDTRAKRFELYVAAYTKKQAIEILRKQTGANITGHHFNNYYSEGWGNRMKGVIPKSPSLYIGTWMGQGLPELVFAEPTPF